MDYRYSLPDCQQTFCIMKTPPKVSVRDTLPSDAQAIFQLRSDPAMSGMQYAPAAHEIPASFLAHVIPSSPMPEHGFCCSTILCQNEFCGFVFQNYYRLGDSKPIVDCGWSLRPQLWGQGIMRSALQLILEDRFANSPQLRVTAACFSDNARCLRLLEKLNFRQEPLPWGEWLGHLRQTYWRKKVLKFGLDAESFRLAPAQNNAIDSKSPSPG